MLLWIELNWIASKCSSPPRFLLILDSFFFSTESKYILLSRFVDIQFAHHSRILLLSCLHLLSRYVLIFFASFHVFCSYSFFFHTFRLPVGEYSLQSAYLLYLFLSHFFFSLFFSCFSFVSLSVSAKLPLPTAWKEKFGFVAIDFDTELGLAAANKETYEKRYELPDGEVITAGSERFRYHS